MSDARVDELSQQVADLTRALEAVTARLDAATTLPTRTAARPDAPEAPMSRRTALRAAGVAAAAALAGGMLTTERASATPTVTPNAFAETASGAAAIYADGNTYAKGLDATSASAAAVYAHTNDGWGVYGVAAGLGTGVQASATNGNALYAISTNGDAISAQAYNHSALLANSADNTIFATSSGDSTKITIWGSSSDATGVLGQSTNYVGVSGASHSGVGVLAGSDLNTGLVSTTQSTGFFALDARGPGTAIYARGARTALRLGPSDVTDATALTGVTGEVVVDTSGQLWYMTGLGWRMLAGNYASGAFTAIAPMRAYDSRRSSYTSHGPITNGAYRTVSVADSHDASGAYTAVDVVPAGATAVSANITVVNTVDTNNFCINPGGDISHPASMINWFGTGQTLANGVSLKISASREVTIVAGGQGGSADVIIDILGYWY